MKCNVINIVIRHLINQILIIVNRIKNPRKIKTSSRWNVGQIKI